jgi:hypothetical protein
MLPIALAGARPHFCEASAHLTLESRVMQNLIGRFRFDKFGRIILE